MVEKHGLPEFEFDADDLILRLDLTIPGAVESVAPAVERIMEEIRRMECAAGKEFEIELALQEALANAVTHGCEENPDKQIQIAVGCDSQRGVLIVVRDPGGGFDPNELPSPVVGEAIFEDHGRGIFLINRLMDEVSFRKRGAEIRMRKHGSADPT